MCSIPSGAATRQTRVTERAPAFLTALTAAALERPVAGTGASPVPPPAARGGRGAARGEHRVEHERIALAVAELRQLHEVLDRLQRLLVAVEADETDARARDQREDAVEPAQAGAGTR